MIEQTSAPAGRRFNTSVGNWRLHGDHVTATVKLTEPLKGWSRFCTLRIASTGMTTWPNGLSETYLIGELSSANDGVFATLRIPSHTGGLKITDVERWLRKYADTSTELAAYMAPVEPRP